MEALLTYALLPFLESRDGAAQECAHETVYVALSLLLCSSKFLGNSNTDYFLILKLKYLLEIYSELAQIASFVLCGN